MAGRDLTVNTATALVAAGFALTLFISFQASVGPDSEYSLGWFHYTTGNVSGMYPTPITPAGYAFSIWGVIYLWTALWITYICTTLFRMGSRGPVYLNPPATGTPFLVAVFIANSLCSGWLLVWDREMLVVAMVILLSTEVLLHTALYVSLSRVYEYLGTFQQVARGDLWAYRILVHNGLAIYTAWVTVASSISVSVTLIYSLDMPSDTATYISLSVLAAELILFFSFDISLLDAYTRYVFMVYPTFTWALAGIMVANGDDPSSPQFIYAAVLLGLSVVFFVTKTVLMIVRDPVVKRSKSVASPGYKFKPLKE